MTKRKPSGKPLTGMANIETSRLLGKSPITTLENSGMSVLERFGQSGGFFNLKKKKERIETRKIKRQLYISHKNGIYIGRKREREKFSSWR